MTTIEIKKKHFVEKETLKITLPYYYKKAPYIAWVCMINENLEYVSCYNQDTYKSLIYRVHANLEDMRQYVEKEMQENGCHEITKEEFYSVYNPIKNLEI